jgi:hypothetical protein
MPDASPAFQMKGRGLPLNLFDSAIVREAPRLPLHIPVERLRGFRACS